MLYPHWLLEVLTIFPSLNPNRCWLILYVYPDNTSCLWFNTYILALPEPSSNWPLTNTPIKVDLPLFYSPIIIIFTASFKFCFWLFLIFSILINPWYPCSILVNTGSKFSCLAIRHSVLILSYISIFLSPNGLPLSSNPITYLHSPWPS